MKIFYGWRMVGAGGIIQFIHAGLLMQAYGAYVAVLSEEKGWSKTALAGGAALQSIEGAVLGPALGWAMDRFGGRAMVQLGIVFFGLGFIVMSQIDTIGGFYAAILLLALGTSLSGYFPLTVTVVHWFRRRRARALSLMAMGLALGGVVVPAVAWMMQTYGWRTTALCSGILSIVVGLPLARVIRRHPSEVGEVEDGMPPEPPKAGEAPVEVEKDLSASQALRTQAFWLLALGHGMALLVVSSVNVHAISHMKEGLGYSVAQASLVITLMTVAQVAGVLMGAAVGDRWNKCNIAGTCMLMHATGLLLLTFASHPLMLAGFAIIHGMAWGLRGPLMQAIRADFFGLRAIGMILGLSAFIIAIGQVMGPMLAGAFADAQGHYRVGFTLLALMAAGGSLLFFLARRPVR